jgi:hypothetical protein
MFSSYFNKNIEQNYLFSKDKNSFFRVDLEEIIAIFCVTSNKVYTLSVARKQEGRYLCAGKD